MSVKILKIMHTNKWGCQMILRTQEFIQHSLGQNKVCCNTYIYICTYTDMS